MAFKVVPRTDTQTQTLEIAKVPYYRDLAPSFLSFATRPVEFLFLQASTKRVVSEQGSVAAFIPMRDSCHLIAQTPSKPEGSIPITLREA